VSDPLEEKILEALKQGPLTATELSAAFSRNLSKERLRPVLQQLEAQQKISIIRTKGTGRPKTIINLRDLTAINEKTNLTNLTKKGAVS
jgi:DNA-binding PadR family transcriptional regulator